MKVDIYSIEESESGPRIASFDHDFLSNQKTLDKGFFSENGIRYFEGLFFPEDMRRVENGLKRVITIEEIKAASFLLDKLSESHRAIEYARRPVIDQYGVDSPENRYIVLMQNYAENMAGFSRHVLENSRNVLVFTHNARPKKWQRERIGNISNGLCSIHKAQIWTRDSESQTYTGKIFYSDHVEGLSNITSDFIAHPIPEEVGFRDMKGLFVRGQEINFVTGGYHLTASHSFNRSAKDYIEGAINS